LPIYKEKSFAERRDAANDAKKALLDKFKSRPPSDSPESLARQAERKAILEAREKREAERAKLREERLAREAAERAERERLAEEARRLAEEESKAAETIRLAEENERIARVLAEEVERKAKRDARYAARKQRVGRQPPKMG
jgi:hypothetical protein